MAGPLSPWLPTVPRCSFWSVLADPEGLLLRATSGAAAPCTGRVFPVPAVCHCRNSWEFMMLSSLNYFVSPPQVTVLSAQQSSKTSAFLCLSALDESTRKSWPCSFFTSSGDLAVLQVHKLVFESEMWDKLICNLKLELWGGYAGSNPHLNQWTLVVNHFCIALSRLDLVVWSTTEMALGPHWEKLYMVT